MIRIPIQRKKQVALLDDNFSHLNQWKWWADSRGYVQRSWRIGTGQKNRRKVLIHHCVAGFPLYGKQIDHIDNNPLNNQIHNLRIVTPRENNHNKRCYHDGSKTSQYMGVHRRKENGRWRASIRIDQKLYNLGTFSNERDAAIAYQTALNELNKQGDQHHVRK